MRRVKGRWSWTLGVGALCAILFVGLSVYNYFPHTYLMGDSPYYAAAAASLIGDGDLKLENNLEGGIDRHAGFVSLGADGEWRPKHPILMSVASVPFVLTFGVIGLLIFNLVIMTLLVMATHRLALRGSAPLPATAATLITCLFTFVLAYVYNFSPDAFAALPALVALIFLLEGRSLRAGLLAGLAVAAKPVHVLFAVVGFAAAWAQGGPRSALKFSAGVFPWIVAMMIYNAVLFGGPLTSGYDRMLEAGQTSQTVSQRDDFTLVGAPANLVGQFLDLKHGLLYTAPSVLVALAGLIPLWRRRQLLAAIFSALLVSYLLFFSTFIPWTASHYGNRYLFIPVLVSVLPLGALLQTLVRSRDPKPSPSALPGPTGTAATPSL